MKKHLLILSVSLALPASWALAQNADAPQRPPRDGERPPGAPRDGDPGRGKEGPRDGQRPPAFGPVPLLHALDTDDDGIISADEIKHAPDALKKLDKNNDGKLTRDEWMPQRQPRGDGPRAQQGQGQAGGDRQRPEGNRRAGARDGDANKAGGEGQRQDGPPPPPLVEAIDTDHDGVISADEIGKSPESLAKLDKNNDGQLGPREYGPRPPQGPRDGEGRAPAGPADRKAN